jgi:hypothetical protein
VWARKVAVFRIAESNKGVRNQELLKEPKSGDRSAALFGGLCYQSEAATAESCNLSA